MNMLMLSLVFSSIQKAFLHDGNSGGNPIDVECTDEQFIVKLYKHHFPLLWEEFTLIDKNCKVSVDGSKEFSFITKKYSECGTTVQTNSTHFSFKNTLFASLGDATSLITRQTNNTVGITCAIERNVNASLYGALNVTQPDQIFINEDGFGSFQLNFNLYKSRTYTTRYQSSEYPVAKNLRDTMYMELALTTDNQQIKINPLSCYATPNNDVNDVTQHFIFMNSCPNDTTYGQAPISSTTFKFYLKSFQFNANQFQKVQQIFFHCTVVVCKTNTNTGKCKWLPPGCVSSEVIARKRRSVIDPSIHTETSHSRYARSTSVSTEHTLSSRMVLFLPSDDAPTRVLTTKKKDTEDEVLTNKLTIIIICASSTLFALSCCCIVVCFVCFVLSRRKRKNKSHANTIELNNIT